MHEPNRPISQQLIVAVVGPTGSGKTALASTIAQALGGEVLGCDALQIRAGLPLLTAKPSPDELAQVPHHLIGVLPLDQAATAARYAALADAVLAELAARGCPAVLCGGTGLYLRALCDGLFAGPPADPGLRSSLKEKAQQLGLAELHRQLAQVDPVAAARINVADYVRIERALEVFLQTGRPISDWFAEHQAERRRGPRYRTLRIALDPGPDALRLRIACRTQSMLDQGLLDEVAAQRRQGCVSDPPLGYDLACQHLDGALTLAELKVALAQQTAQYARRQRTWFRREEGVTWYPDAAAVPLGELVAAVRRVAA